MAAHSGKCVIRALFEGLGYWKQMLLNRIMFQNPNTHSLTMPTSKGAKTELKSKNGATISVALLAVGRNFSSSISLILSIKDTLKNA